MSEELKKKNPLWNNDNYSFTKYAVIITVLFLLYICFFNSDNVIRWVRAGVEIHKQERQMQVYRSEIHEMDGQIKRLSTDQDTLETFAREQFHFAAPGDDVYLDPK